MSEQSAQALHIMNQVEKQISKAIEDASKQEVQRSELFQLKTEVFDRMRAQDQKAKEDLRESLAKLSKNSLQPLETRLRDLESRTREELNERLASALT